MDLDLQRYIGSDVYGRDDMKIGTLERVMDDGDYVVVDRTSSPHLVLPRDELRLSGDRLLIGRTKSYLDDAPAVDTRGTLSPQDRERLERFYRPRAA